MEQSSFPYNLISFASKETTVKYLSAFASELLGPRLRLDQLPESAISQSTNVCLPLHLPFLGSVIKLTRDTNQLVDTRYKCFHKPTMHFMTQHDISRLWFSTSDT